MELSLLASIPVLLLLVIFCYVLFEIVYRRSFGDLSKLPGPIALPLIGTQWRMPKDFAEMEYLGMKWLDEFGRKHGAQAAWLGLTPTLIVTKPELVKEIIGGSKHTKKSMPYRLGLEPWLGTGLLTSYGDKWKTRRRLITPAFHFEILNGFADIMTEQADVLVQQLEAHADSGEVIDIFEFITRCTLDIICETAMGVSLNAQTKSKDKEHPYVTAVYKMSDLFIKRILNPLLFIDFFLNLHPIGAELRQTLKTLHEFTASVVKQRRSEFDALSAEDAKRRPFLDLLLQTKQDDGSPLSDEDIQEEVDTFMFEGHDTTSAATAWAIQLIANDSQVQEKLFAEINQVFGTSNQCSIEQVNQLKYMELVNKECLRLKPSVPMIGRELTQDLFIDGIRIPAGVNVNIAIWEMHRDPEIWGPTADKFNPDRFAVESEISPFAYIPFSAGSRNCIGQRFAQMEEKILLAKIFQRFRIEPVAAHLPAFPEVILRPKQGTGVPVKIYRR